MVAQPLGDVGQRGDNDDGDALVRGVRQHLYRERIALLLVTRVKMLQAHVVDVLVRVRVRVMVRVSVRVRVRVRFRVRVRVRARVRVRVRVRVM